MRERPAGEPWSATMVIIVANTVVFLLQSLADIRPESQLAALLRHATLVPGELAHGAVWQLLTFQFMHDGLIHLGINCLVLYLFGRSLEAALGRRTFWQLYLATGALGGLLQAACAWVFPGHFGPGGTVGASAGVSGLVAAFAMMNRGAPITLLFPPVTLRATHLLIVLFVMDFLGVLQRGSTVAHAAHLGGMLGGVAYVRFLLGRPRGRRAWHWPKIGIMRRRPTVVVMAAPAPKFRVSREPRAERPVELPPEEFMQQEVDPILDKISSKGIHSLTERERRILEAAGRKITR
ncbi:MAG: rhomboid family intramembrane serine protease [Verrucomicrobiales bacterium]|nr:rhomboid family intramembrane serine protease [Verrucomicrobiales bacterium]